MLLSHFDHVTIAVDELSNAVTSYARLLGSAPVWRGVHPELGTEAALFGVSNALIELVGPRSGAEQAEGLRGWLAARGEGLLALAFGSPDASASFLALRERGLRAAPPQAGQALDEAGQLRSYRVIELSPRSTRGVPVYVVERADFAALTAPPSAATATPGAAVALDHVVLRTADPAAAIKLYADGLGLRLALDRELFGTRMLFFRGGGVTLEVVQDPALGEQDVLWGLAYRTTELAAAHARLRAHGLAVSELRDGRKAGTQVFSVQDGSCGVPTLWLRDPARE